MEIKVCSFRFCKYGVWENSVARERVGSRFWPWRSILEFCSLDRRFSMFLRFVDSDRCCKVSRLVKEKESVAHKRACERGIHARKKDAAGTERDRERWREISRKKR